MSHFSALWDSIPEQADAFFSNDMLVFGVVTGVIVLGVSIAKVVSLSSKN